MATALITAREVIDRAFTNKNTDTYLVKPAFIEVAELNFLQPNIGEKVYQSLKDDVSNGTQIVSIPSLTSEITCAAASDDLHHKYFTLYSVGNYTKYAVYFQVLNTDAINIPTTYDSLIAVDLTATGSASTGTEVATAITTAVVAKGFTASSAINVCSIDVPYGAGTPTNGNNFQSQLSFSISGDFGITLGSNTVTCTANGYIQVGDFVSGDGVALREDGTSDCREHNTVATVDTPGAVTSFTITGKSTITKTNANLSFQRPNGKLLNDYVLDYLAFCVRFEMLPDMAYNTTSQGLVENTGDYSLPVDAKTLSYVRGETYKKAETYLRKMQEFFSDNSRLFPDYCCEDDNGVSKKNGIILY